jgi:hypothetical protein
MGADQAKVTIDARDLAIKDLVSQLAQQTGASIVLDPKAHGSVTISLKDSDLNQALDTVANLGKLTWKKLQFAKPTEENVKLDEIKSAMLTLASLSMVGLSVEDPKAKTSTVFAKGLASTPDTSGLKLPEGYSWATVYVILPTESASDKTATDKASSGAGTAKQVLMELAKMTPEERKQYYAAEMSAEMSMAPEVRRSLFKGRLQAQFSMDRQSRDQYRQDMHSVYHDLRAENPSVFQGGGSGGPDGGRSRRNRGGNRPAP